MTESQEEEDSFELNRIDEGIKAADSGKVVPEEEVQAEFSQWRRITSDF